MESKKNKKHKNDFIYTFSWNVCKIKTNTAKLCTIIYLCAIMFCTCHAVHKHDKNMAK
jgi:hypothetical protein